MVFFVGELVFLPYFNAKELSLVSDESSINAFPADKFAWRRTVVDVTFDFMTFCAISSTWNGLPDFDTSR